MLAGQIVSCNRNMFAWESETSNKRVVLIRQEMDLFISWSIRVPGVTSMPLLQRRCDNKQRRELLCIQSISTIVLPFLCRQ